MDDPTLERDLVENEAVFREFNKRMQKSVIESSKKSSKGDGAQIDRDAKVPVYFFCECADANCQEPIKIRPSVYNQIHKDNSKFVLVPGHEIEKIEEIIEQKPEYNVVKKRLQPPKNPDHLNPTH